MGMHEQPAADDGDALIRMEGVNKVFGNFTALSDVSIDVREGEFLTLLGPSGSGKSTTLMCLAGFETPTRGRILYRGEDVTRLSPEKRGLGVVFQGYALFPHMTVAENVGYPLVVRKVPKAERDANIRAMLSTVGLGGYEDRRIQGLSGGQQQRVALARALIFGPKLLLLDEPFSALDRSLRGEMQSELARIHKELGTAFVFVTHDQDEALSLSDRIAVFNKGKMEQVASPSDIYEAPASTFVAGFVGKTNLLDVTDLVAGNGNGLYRARYGDVEIICKGPEHLAHAGSGKLSVRAEEAELHASAPASADLNAIKVRLLRSVYFGGWVEALLEDSAGKLFSVRLTTTRARHTGLQDGRDYWLSWPKGTGYLVPA
ncbi:putative spermidine/putrescine transport system ATP-binding protein [Shinella granuli]|uniref:Putative spermidine/putrescine transport system ATP-binding protein n=2 Tax=Shinella granuli TaxID=323621 RepID=A0A4R2CUD4_SHIGR|nr:putative spermidine/putrescine transport system ATP-binding protein [Shinella granuli]